MIYLPSAESTEAVSPYVHPCVAPADIYTHMSIVNIANDPYIFYKSQALHTALVVSYTTIANDLYIFYTSHCHKLYIQYLWYSYTTVANDPYTSY